MREASDHADHGWELDAADLGAPEPSGPTAGVALLEEPSVVDLAPIAMSALAAEPAFADLDTTEHEGLARDIARAPLALWYLRFPFDCF